MIWHLISFALWAYFFCYAAGVVFSFKRVSRVHVAFNILLVLIGLWAFASGSAISIILSSGIGIAYLPLAVGMTCPSLEYFLRFRYKFRIWLNALFKERNAYLPILFNTLKEELVWRSAFVYVGRWNNIPDAVLLVLGSFLFYLVHWNPKSRIVLLTEVEFLCFSCLLYLAYIKLETLVGVWLIHFIRNSYLRFCRSNGQME
ncbi:MAG: CPBP family glutamic-type intramembrane protease [Bacteroidota bacterium]